VSLELPSIGPAAVTLGVFDGVHRGHRHLAEATVRAAHERGARSVALVFDPPPIEVIRPGTTVPRLLPVDLVPERLRQAGIERVVVVRFDDEVRQMTPEAFLEALGPAIDLKALTMTPGSALWRSGRSEASTRSRSSH
jgi:riboflavin kinase/FMN adenylyltransferase